MKDQRMGDANVAVQTQKAKQQRSSSLIQTPSQEVGVLHSSAASESDVLDDHQEAEEQVKACQLESEELRGGADTSFAQQEVYHQPVGGNPQERHRDHSGQEVPDQALQLHTRAVVVAGSATRKVLHPWADAGD